MVHHPYPRSGSVLSIIFLAKDLSIMTLLHVSPEKLETASSVPVHPGVHELAVSRRQLLRRGAQGAALLGMAGGLGGLIAACAPTSTSVGAPVATSAPA